MRFDFKQYLRNYINETYPDNPPFELNERSIKWVEDDYLQNAPSKIGRSFDTEEDGVDGWYNPRFEKGKRVTSTPKMTSEVVDDLKFSDEYSPSFYAPWYTIISVSSIMIGKKPGEEVVIKDKVSGRTYTATKSNSASKWKIS